VHVAKTVHELNILLLQRRNFVDQLIVLRLLFRILEKLQIAVANQFSRQIQKRSFGLAIAIAGNFKVLRVHSLAEFLGQLDVAYRVVTARARTHEHRRKVFTVVASQVAVQGGNFTPMVIVHVKHRSTPCRGVHRTLRRRWWWKH